METERRLAQAQAMISQYSSENARMAAASEAAASRRALVDSDYKSESPSGSLISKLPATRLSHFA